MKYLTAHLPYKSLIQAMLLTATAGLAHATTIDTQPSANPEELQNYLFSHGYRTQESCPRSSDQGSCWARSIMTLLSDQELSNICSQMANHHLFSKDQPTNAAALHLYLESHSSGTPDGATPGVPINNLNLQLAILLKKTILTVTMLPEGKVATQTFTESEDGQYVMEEHVISLSEEPEALFIALQSADISLLLTPAVDGLPGHVQPILFSWQTPQTPEAAQLRELLNTIRNRPARVIDIFAVSTGDMPAYFFSSLPFGANHGRESLTKLRKEREEREKKAAKEKQKTAKENLEHQLEQHRRETSEQYRKNHKFRYHKFRFCQNCAIKAGKLSIIGVASAITYQKWETVKSYLISFWEELLVPQLPLIARLDGLGAKGKAEAIPPELADYLDTLPQKVHELWTYYYPKVRDAVSHLTGSAPPPQVFASQMLTAVNDLRSQPQTCGHTNMPAVAKLTWNDSLKAAAKRHSEDMANNNFLEHTGSDGSEAKQRIEAQGYRWSAYGENVAVGYSSINTVLKGWMSNEGHCKNIMNPDYTEMGASSAENSFSVYRRIYWAQVFATRKTHNVDQDAGEMFEGF